MGVQARGGRREEGFAVFLPFGVYRAEAFEGKEGVGFRAGVSSIQHAGCGLRNSFSPFWGIKALLL